VVDVELIASGIPGMDELIGGLPEGELIIVAGGPGTGKTMLSAGFIYWGAVKYGQRGVYVSLSEDRETFMRNMRAVGYDFEKLEERGLFKFLDLLTLMETGTAELLKLIISETTSFKAQRLVVDSLTAIAQGVSNPRELRVFLHSLLSRIMRELNCTAILIEEVPFGEKGIGHGFEEFVASAVIVLEKDMIDDKFMRRIRIEKLRGSPVPNNRACFTLRSGFEVFPPYRHQKIENPKSLRPPRDPPNRYSTGIEDLDLHLGGYPKGSTALLEIDPRITRDQYRIITWPHSAGFLQKGRPIITIPGMGSNLRDVNAFYEAYAITEEQRRISRHFLAASSIGYNPPQNIIPYDPNEGADAFISKLEDAAESLLKECGKPPLITVSMDSIEFNYGDEGTLKIVARLSAWTRRNEGLSLLVDKLTFPEISKRLASIATIHLKLTRKHGCLLLYGVKPRTTLYAVKLETEEGYYQTRLIPII